MRKHQQLGIRWAQLEFSVFNKFKSCCPLNRLLKVLHELDALSIEFCFAIIRPRSAINLLQLRFECSLVLDCKSDLKNVLVIAVCKCDGPDFVS